MEATFKAICDQHDLYAVSVMYQGGRWDYVSVYLHWHRDDGERQVATGGGATFDAALASALTDMFSLRPNAAARRAVEGHPAGVA